MVSMSNGSHRPKKSILFWACSHICSSWWDKFRKTFPSISIAGKR